jgi:hypothetical protein
MNTIRVVDLAKSLNRNYPSHSAMKSDPVSRAAFNRFPNVWPFFYFLTSTFVLFVLFVTHINTHTHTAGSGRQIFPSNLGVCS